MQFIFLDMAGQTLFVRDDAERAEWTQEEKTVSLEFPYYADKVISTGQRVFFKDQTGEAQIFEVKTAGTIQPEAFQQITAEHICISELTDDHMEEQKLTNVTCQTALNGVLSGTLWSVGNLSTNPVSSADLPRGSVWQAILDIQANWNVYIVPRVTLSSDGTITRKLDVKSTAGEWNGVRLSIDKNLLDPTVTYDDTELTTALYGYGGTINGTTATAPDTDVDFSSVVWTATADHPAKPAGQRYLEDPAATAAFGRNGRARFGFYQNTDITDPEILLRKTWEALKQSNSPAISIEGTVADLYRMGYADQPIKLHDIALVEVLPTGFKKQLQIIRETVNLLDPSETVLTIGAYIPNIIYIDRNTADNTTGIRGGGKNKNTATTTWHEFRTQVSYLENGTGIRFQAVQNDINHQEEEIAVQSGRIDVAYNRIDLEVQDRRDSDNILAGRITVEAERITQEVTRATGAETTLSGRITVEANRITQEVTDRTNADSTLSGRITVEAGRITQEVTDRTNADTALSGRINVEKDRITAEVTRATGAESTLSGQITVEAGRITQEVTDRTNADSTLSGRIDVQANRIGLVVEGTGTNAKIKAAQIVASINDQTGTSIAKIAADRVIVDGTTSINDVFFVNNGTVGSKGSFYIGNGSNQVTIDVSGQNADVRASDFYVGDDIIFRSGDTTLEIDFATLSGMIKAFSVSGNTLTLTPFVGNAVNFSKVASISGSWSNANKTYTANATPGTNSVSTTFYNATCQSVSQSSIAKVLTANIRIAFDGDPDDGEATGVFSTNVSVDGTITWNAGNTAVTLQDPTWSNTLPNNSNQNIATIKTSGRTTQLSKTVAITLVQSSWSSGSKTVDANNSDGVRVARSTVSMPTSISVSGKQTSSDSEKYNYDTYTTINANEQYTWISLSVGGKTYKVRVHPIT